MGMLKVVPLSEREREISKADDLRCRRLAIQLATQLPDNTEEALLVLDHARTLVRSFLGDPKPA